MFRIKTALLACLLLVAATSSVSALDQTQEPRLSSFGEFLAVNHQSAAQGAQVLAAITLRANLSIQDAKASRFSMPRIYINGIQQLLAGYGNLLIELADSKSTQIDTDQLDVLVKEAVSAVIAKNISKTVSSLEQILSILKELN